MCRIRRCSSEFPGGYDPVPEVGDAAAQVPLRVSAGIVTRGVLWVALMYGLHRKIQSHFEPNRGVNEKP